MATNVEIERKKNESSTSMIKRFTRKVQETGIINRVKSERYEERTPSEYTKKKNKLKVLKKKAEYEKMFKLGKISGYRK